MISRRAALGTGAATAVLAGAAAYGTQAGKIDDLARTVGLDPKPRPAESDKALIAQVRRDTSALLEQALVTSASHTALAKGLAPVIEIAQQHLEQLGGEISAEASPPPPAPVDAINAVITSHKVAAAQREKDALAALSGEFAQVLASMSVSASQSVRALRAARKDVV